MTAQPRMSGAATALKAPDLAHIGYHRTGTNFLQSEVFPALTEHLHAPDGSGWQLFQDSDFDLAAAQAYYAPRRAEASDRLLVLTHESLSGTLLSDDADNPDKLARLNPDMRILVVLRSQYGIFPSLYHLHVKGSGKLRYADFLRRALDGGKCDYLTMIERLHADFGPERVWVGLYEDLSADPQGLVDDLCRFLCLPTVALAQRPAVVNRRSGAAVIKARRAANELLAEDEPLTGWRLGLRELAGDIAHKTGELTRRLGAPAPAGLDDDESRDAIRARHAKNNRRLAELLGRPLGELGYPA